MPALEIIALETTTPQLRAPASGDTYSAPRALNITPETLTGSLATSSLSIAQTWNTTGTPTAIDLNVTDTASNGASRLMDLRVGGVSVVSASKTAVIRASQISFSSSAGQTGVQDSLGGGSGGLYLGSTRDVAWSSATGAGSGSIFSGTRDLVLARDAANTLAQRNGVNAQAFNIYNTYTDASNYERGFVRWSSNTLQIGTDKLGTGTARELQFHTDGVTRWTITSTGTLQHAGTNGIVTWTASVIGGAISLGGATRSAIRSNGEGIFSITNNSNTDFGRLQFGGTTSSFPALKRSTTSLQAVLADDTGFTNIQGKLTTATAYTAGAPTATGYLVLYDSNGTAYKVPAEAL